MPSPFPFISLKDVEPVFGNAYYKLRTAYLIPTKNSNNLHSKLYMMLENFIIRELKTVKTYQEHMEYRLNFLKRLTIEKENIGNTTCIGCGFLFSSKKGLQNHISIHQNIRTTPHLHSALLAHLFIEEQFFIINFCHLYH